MIIKSLSFLRLVRQYFNNTLIQTNPDLSFFLLKSVNVFWFRVIVSTLIRIQPKPPKIYSDILLSLFDFQKLDCLS